MVYENVTERRNHVQVNSRKRGLNLPVSPSTALLVYSPFLYAFRSEIIALDSQKYDDSTIYRTLLPSIRYGHSARILFSPILNTWAASDVVMNPSKPQPPIFIRKKGADDASTQPHVASQPRLRPLPRTPASGQRSQSPSR